MSKKSAGLLMYKQGQRGIEVFLVHPGGPFWEKKDAGAWSIPKGEYAEGEDPLTAAKREFEEETGFPPVGHFHALTPIRQPSGKSIFAWAFEGYCDAASIKSNTFTMEWPRGSGTQSAFPEVDRAEWFPIKIAKSKILKGQVPFLEQLEKERDGHQENVSVQQNPSPDLGTENT